MKWWEKTVEYAYVSKFIGAKTLAAPLDGKEEYAGDAILANADGFVLVEFKRDSASLSSEPDKYVNYDAAVTAMKAKDRSHFIVYGEEVVEDGRERLALRAKFYFSNNSVNPEKILNLCSKKEYFKEYVKELLTHKKKGGEVDQGSGGLVAGVCGDDAIVMTLNEFVELYDLKPEQVMVLGMN